MNNRVSQAEFSLFSPNSINPDGYDKLIPSITHAQLPISGTEFGCKELSVLSEKAWIKERLAANTVDRRQKGSSYNPGISIAHHCFKQLKFQHGFQPGEQRNEWRCALDGIRVATKRVQKWHVRHGRLFF